MTTLIRAREVEREDAPTLMQKLFGSSAYSLEVTGQPFNGRTVNLAEVSTCSRISAVVQAVLNLLSLLFRKQEIEKSYVPLKVTMEKNNYEEVEKTILVNKKSLIREIWNACYQDTEDPIKGDSGIEQMANLISSMIGTTLQASVMKQLRKLEEEPGGDEDLVPRRAAVGSPSGISKMETRENQMLESRRGSEMSDWIRASPSPRESHENKSDSHTPEPNRSSVARGPSAAGTGVHPILEAALNDADSGSDTESGRT